MRRRLIPHPAFPAPPVSIEAGINRPTPDSIAVRFDVTGDVVRIRLPAPAAPARTDGLWKHTCFELFLRVPGEESYSEFNISPSSEWAAYSFTGYREGMTERAGTQPPVVEFLAGSSGFSVAFVVSSVGAASTSAGELSGSVCAVLEADDGSLSYWALTHPSERPDFHNPAGFILTLPAGP